MEVSGGRGPSTASMLWTSDMEEADGDATTVEWRRRSAIVEEDVDDVDLVTLGGDPPIRARPLYIERIDCNSAIIRGQLGWEGTEEQWEQRRKRKKDGRKSNLQSASMEIVTPPSRPPEVLARSDEVRKEGWVSSLRRRFRICPIAVSIACCPPCPDSIYRKLTFAAPACSYKFSCDGVVLSASNRAAFGPRHRFRVSYSYALPTYTSRYFSDHCLWELKGRLLDSRLGSRLAAVYLPFPDPTCVIIYFHGNAMDIGTSIPFMYKLRRKLGAAVVAVDYSGYGLSSGKSSEEMLYADAEAVVAWVQDDQDGLSFPVSHLVLYGFSLGSAAAAHVAALNPSIRGLVLAGAFTSVFSVVRLLSCCVSVQRQRPGCDRLKTYEKIPRIQTTKVLVIHGTRDEIVGVDHALWLLAHLPDAVRPLFLLATAHNDLIDKPQTFVRLVEFIHDDLGFRLPFRVHRLSFGRLLRQKAWERG